MEASLLDTDTLSEIMKGFDQPRSSRAMKFYGVSKPVGRPDRSLVLSNAVSTAWYCH
jgi:hypothetical protein